VINEEMILENTNELLLASNPSHRFLEIPQLLIQAIEEIED